MLSIDDIDQLCLGSSFESEVERRAYERAKKERE